ncbi:rod shape determining protein RodA [Sphingomonas naasensis]|uniref:Peptidoglycan glycosyltransferase MrdB n=1 Tax=Sphingomonas naasensis TaxID=1344951 RepID=A0A4S1WM52_9SPHN|nr:rod shape-determining protein RodA [Sphingomonas naasensis]NIJ20205.1 rod shape determining protein RodA [Sphingomonas naasensis]TGX44349.1 rod shape-determining protein RodA [Sphingomonas naasensis]
MSKLGPGLVPAPLAQLPWKVMLLVLAIGSFGLVVLYSAAGGSLYPWAFSQGIRFFVFFGMAIALSRIPEGWWALGTFPAYALVLLMLLGVEALGAVAGGSQRWLDLGIIRLQPSELMKPIIVLTMARFYEILPASEIRKFGALWPAAVLIGLPAALVMLQPDLGTALMITGSGVAVMFLAGIPLRLFIGGGLLLGAAIPIVVNFVLHDYQRNRVLVFLDPESDPLGTGYHISQSKIAIGSGGIFGKGFLNGTQSHLDYLPEGHTDFALATMMEEWGLMGGFFVILAFSLLIGWAIGVSMRAKSRFGRLTAAGLSATIFFYAAINMLMVVGLAPVVGIPLPLISFGGTAQMTFMICFGILMSIDRESRRKQRW